MNVVPDRIEVIQGNITTLEVDAVVNAANSSLLGGGGVDGAIHRAGGPTILEECREIVAARGPCPPGAAVVTGGGDLPARLVIHAVGPVWTGDDRRADDHDRTLASCYRRSLGLAAEHGARSIAFPNISTGVYGFPKDRAARVAVEAVAAALDDDPPIDRVVFCCFDDENLAQYRALLGR